MIKKQHKLKLQNEMDNLEPELLTNFIKYWSLRKSNPFITDNVVKQLKQSESSKWFSLIESNHKFRALYGEDIANELVRSINKDGGNLK